MSRIIACVPFGAGFAPEAAKMAALLSFGATVLAIVTRKLLRVEKKEF